ncbi:hypothetical protein BJ878DRAFT_475903 [Calycina marina]|uniref:N-acetyltransferase domain-containing protein n=1 Tax=Calycina marina TaxID=1763456 RepID=A0A9P7ZC58_9HELO|nr:hypothetical protein BJ878DRAFT_475903 [Calycina marina]
MEATPFTGSDAEITAISKLWAKIFPDWSIEQERFARLLKQDGGHHVIHPHGFCIGQLSGHTAMISAIGVQEEHRKKGLGTKLMRETYRLIGEKVSAGTEIKFSIKSGFPRFWSGVPKDIMKLSKGFFIKQGFSILKEPTDRDYFRSITTSIATPELEAKVAKLPLTFAPLTPAGYAECIAKQHANFGHNAAWVAAYTALASRNLHHDIMVAYSPTGSQIGWTIMASPSDILCQNFAFMPLSPSGENTGLIACVGVAKEGRSKGVGTAMILAAMRSMKERGIDGVFIDSAIIVGFYESLGYEIIFEYEKFGTLMTPPKCMT